MFPSKILLNLAAGYRQLKYFPLNNMSKWKDIQSNDTAWIKFTLFMRNLRIWWREEKKRGNNNNNSIDSTNICISGEYNFRRPLKCFHIDFAVQLIAIECIVRFIDDKMQ